SAEVLGRDDVLTLAVLGVLAREHGRPRLDGLELLLDLLELRRGKHVVVQRRLVGVLEREVPPTEHDVLELRELEEIRDLLTGRGIVRLGNHAVPRNDAAGHEAGAGDHGGRNGAVDADDDYTELVLHPTSTL